MFRSVVLPFKALVMNSLSLLASYGALVVVFQDGFGADLLRFRPLGFVEGRCPSCCSACCSVCHESKKRTTRAQIPPA